MGIKVSVAVLRLRERDAERRRRDSAVLRAMAGKTWRRPCDIAQRAGMPLVGVVACLRRLEHAGKTERRELVLRVIRGRARPRYTTRLRVEYRALKPKDWSRMPAWLQLPPPGAASR